jgi:menaquinol-cytochrome c reductase iron-sulfur subunit
MPTRRARPLIERLQGFLIGLVLVPVARVVAPAIMWLLARRRAGAPPPVQALGAADEPRPEIEARRRFLTRVTLAAGGLVGGLLGVPFAVFVFRPGPRDAPTWRSVGEAAAFAVGRTVKVDYLDPSPLPWAGFSAETAAWLRRESETEFVAFTIYCTHTGCPVRWEEGADLFMCPCHGGAFYRDGTVASGPPPIPLTRYPVRVRDGVVEIETTPIPGRIPA